MEYGIFVIYENGQTIRYEPDFSFDSPEDAKECMRCWRITGEHKLPIGGLYFTALPIWK